MLKREIRILGLSGTTIGHKTIIASIVFRGSRWLDGVATAMVVAKERNYNLEVSHLIKTSKQFSQLHAIIISQRLTFNRAISIQDLARRVKLPVIAITNSHSASRREDRRVNKLAITVGGRHVVAARVDKDQAEMLYGISCSRGSKVPEAVRIADLLTEELSKTFESNSITPDLELGRSRKFVLNRR